MSLERGIDSLKEKYKNQEEALEEIRRAEDDIAYYLREGKIEEGKSHLVQLEAFLNDWF